MALERLRNLSLSVGSALGWRRDARRAIAPWGDGLVDQPLADLWYPSRWEEVGTDELVYLIPSLAAQASQVGVTGPLVTARRVLSARVYHAASVLREPTRDPGDGSSEALDALAQSGALSTMDPFEAWASGRAAASEFGVLARPSPERFKSVSPQGVRNVCIFELAVVACLDRMHFDARNLAGYGDTRARAPITLADALVASIYATFNAAYVYPQFACVQELMSTGAWLGNLVKGRPALMPVFVAECLAAEFDRKYATDGGEAERSTSILRFHAEQAVGLSCLHEFAQRVKSSGRPLLVKPRPLPAFGFEPYVWNTALFRAIGHRLDLGQEAS